MNLRNHYDQLDSAARARLADALGTSKAYLRQLVHGHRQAGLRILMRIAAATDGAVSQEDLRPDLFPGESPPTGAGGEPAREMGASV